MHETTCLVYQHSNVIKAVCGSIDTELHHRLLNIDIRIWFSWFTN